MVIKDFYSPGELRFTRQQFLWLLWNLETLQTGIWPSDASSYELYIGKKTGIHRAYFETPIEYAIEVEQRLEKCGIDGLILEAIECWGKSITSMANYFRMPEWSIKQRRNNALTYVASGPARRWHHIPKRKGETYQEFKKRRRREKLSKQPGEKIAQKQ